MLMVSTCILLCLILALGELIFKVVDQLSQESPAEPFDFMAVDLLIKHTDHLWHDLTPEEAHCVPHLEVFDFQILDLLLVVLGLLFYGQFLVLNGSLVLGKQSFGLVMDEVT